MLCGFCLTFLVGCLFMFLWGLDIVGCLKFVLLFALFVAFVFVVVSLCFVCNNLYFCYFYWVSWLLGLIMELGFVTWLFFDLCMMILLFGYFMFAFFVGWFCLWMFWIVMFILWLLFAYWLLFLFCCFVVWLCGFVIIWVVGCLLELICLMFVGCLNCFCVVLIVVMRSAVVLITEFGDYMGVWVVCLDWRFVYLLFGFVIMRFCGL